MYLNTPQHPVSYILCIKSIISWATVVNVL